MTIFFTADTHFGDVDSRLECTVESRENASASVWKSRHFLGVSVRRWVRARNCAGERGVRSVLRNGMIPATSTWRLSLM